ncbi:MAG: pyruvate, phosphate dikinase [Chloroflexi bacterium]|nr:pyruvate, phosphate dikinase [Chloroflexota bacterium]
MATTIPQKTMVKASAKKWVYLLEEGSAQMRDLLGGKGAGLAEMARLGLPVPPGFTITTAACNAYFQEGNKFPAEMWKQVEEALAVVEERTGKKFGDAKNPLLVSVRSGAKFSMPGMMDTVLNLGLNDQTAQGLVALSGNERFVWDAYRRLLQMFGKIVLDLPAIKFEDILDHYKEKRGTKSDTDLTIEDLKAITAEFKQIIRSEKDVDFPQEPKQQLEMAVQAVFDSWFGKRAVDYRNFHRIPHGLGTAANVVAMVFGNLGPDSGTGVAFTRDPATGEKALFGEYLLNAQGEDVVAGIRTPRPISQLAQEMPAAHQELQDISDTLEKHYREMQDVEFTVEKGKLWMLQTRTGKRTAQAAVKIAVDMVQEGLITEKEAVGRVEPGQIDLLLHPRFDPQAKEKAILLAKGLNASPGAAVGMAAFDADTAEVWGKEGKPVILVRPETNPDDVHGMLLAQGILTSRGGATSHAAVVARGLGKPCVAGVEEIKIDAQARQFSANGQTVQEGDYLSLDGGTGEVFFGELPTVRPKFEEEHDLQMLLAWADKIRRLGVWANADYPRDAVRARSFGAEGIGLARTEHMFFEEERLPLVQQMILAASEEERKEALDRLLPIQKEDFKGIFRAMDGLPVVIRLIDPPLHEFLPRYEELVVEVTELKVRNEDLPRLAEREKLLHAVEGMREANPMLGLRGVRLGILFPEINKMQVRAIMEAALEVKDEGVDARPEIMIPLVGLVQELKIMRQLLEKVAEEVTAEKGKRIEYKFGTMIELPRAALTADEIAKYAEFFSFGTNDLTQTTMGISRDDAEGKFLLHYVQEGIILNNPFQTLDQEGVGKLVEMGVRLGRATKPELKVGICGEHGGDPASIAFFHRVGLDYVSCSPFRVPVARLAAAHAALGGERGDI